MTPKPLTSSPVTEFTSAQLVEIMNAGFEEYIIPAHFQVVGLEARMSREHLDRNASQVFFVDGQAAGVVMVDRRGWQSRIGAMGVAKAFRGQGYGKQMLGSILAAAQAQGDRSVTLEVFEENHSAVTLYKKLGFQRTRRLVGYTKTTESGSAEPLVEIDPLEFSRIVAQEGDPNLPWMLAAETWAGFTGAKAYALEDKAFALIQDTAGQNFVLWALVVHKAVRRQGWGTRMARGLMYLHPGKNAQIVQIVPEDLAPAFFEGLGFTKTALNQMEMRLEF